MTTSIIEHNHISWINIVEPTSDDVHNLKKQFPQIHYLNLRDCLQDLEFPKMDDHGDYLFIVIQLPLWSHEKRISSPCEVDIFVNEKAVITSHSGHLKPMREVFERVKSGKAVRSELMDNGTGALLYEILYELIEYCFPIINKVNQNIRHIEEHLFSAETEHILKDISFVRRDVIALRHVLNPQRDVLNALLKGKWAFIANDLDPYWSNLNDHLSQLLSLLNEHMDVIQGLSDTIDTLASHRIDGVVRVLTLITILTAPLTLLATVFGINVELLPNNQGYHLVLFFIVNAFGVILTLLLLFYLKNKKWL